MAQRTVTRQVKISGRSFVLRSTDVVHALDQIDPDPINSHFVVIGGRRFPPKQVISAVTGLDRADFTTHQARRTLMRLGFVAGRRDGAVTAPNEPDGRRDAGAGCEPLADRLRHLSGQWVAIKDDDVIHASRSPQELVAWLGEHGRKADTMFRVPEDELAATGLAPL